MSKKIVLFYFYCFVIVTILIVALVLFPKTKFLNFQYLLNLKTEQPETKPSDNTSTENKEEKPSKTYATDIELMIPREISVENGSKVILNNNFLKVNPAEQISNVEIEITSKVGNDDGIDFKNNIITAKETGFYYITFTVSSSETTEITETLVIHVIDKREDVIQLKDNVFENESFLVEELFEIKNIFTVQNVKVEGSVAKTENLLKFTTSGGCIIEFTLNLDMISYVYQFNITVNKLPPPPQYCIEIINFEDDEISMNFVKNKRLTIQYVITNKNEEFVPQGITLNLSNNDVVEIISADELFIVLKFKQIGTVNIEIVCDADENVTRSLTIILN